MDIYFGPKPPNGKESNWLPTDPKWRFFLPARFYGQEPGLFNKKFELNDVVKETKLKDKKVAHQIQTIVAICGVLLFSHVASAQPATSIPADGEYVADTRLGKLRLEYGYPTKETAKRLYDEMDFQRAVQAYLWSIPLVAMQALHERLQQQNPSLQASVIFEDLLPPSTTVFTGNNTTFYAISTFIIEPDDPVVVEIPAGAVLGMINNAWQQSLADLGPPGPDQGKGGKYLILPPAYEGEVPEAGYFVLESDSFQNYYLLRAFETGAAGVNKLKEIRAYRWSRRCSTRALS